MGPPRQSDALLDRRPGRLVEPAAIAIFARFRRGAQARFRIGEVAEWLKAHAWKACLRETVTRVRIPLSPPPTRAHSALVDEPPTTLGSWPTKWPRFLAAHRRSSRHSAD